MEKNEIANIETRRVLRDVNDPDVTIGESVMAAITLGFSLGTKEITVITDKNGVEYRGANTEEALDNYKKEND